MSTLNSTSPLLSPPKAQAMTTTPSSNEPASTVMDEKSALSESKIPGNSALLSRNLFPTESSLPHNDSAFRETSASDEQAKTDNEVLLAGNLKPERRRRYTLSDDQLRHAHDTIKAGDEAYRTTIGDVERIGSEHELFVDTFNNTLRVKHNLATTFGRQTTLSGRSIGDIFTLSNASILRYTDADLKVIADTLKSVAEDVGIGRFKLGLTREEMQGFKNMLLDHAHFLHATAKARDILGSAEDGEAIDRDKLARALLVINQYTEARTTPAK